MMNPGQKNFLIVTFVNYKTNNLSEFLKKINMEKTTNEC